MSFILPTMRLTWDETTDYPGMEVVMTVPSIDGLATATNLRFMARHSGSDEAEALRSTADRMADVVADHLVSWNLKSPRDGNPDIPPDRAGVGSIGIDQLADIIGRWIEGATKPTAPLSRPSTGGVPSLVASIPMEPLSTNPPNTEQPQPFWGSSESSPATP